MNADAIPVAGTSITDIDIPYFNSIFVKIFSSSPEDTGLQLPILLKNMNLMTQDSPNIACMLLVGKYNQFKLPVFMVKAISFPGNDIHVSSYKDSEDISGNIE